MVLKKIEIVGLILMLLHWMVLRVSAARHGMDVGSIAESNLDEQTVEQMCRDCGLDLIAIKEEVQKSGAYLSKDIFLDSTKISTRAELLTKGTIQEALNVLSPEANRSFLDCLMKRNFLLDSSQEEILRIWLTDYLDSLLNQLHTRRRLLAAQDYEDMSPSLAPDLPSNDDSTLPNEPTSEPALAKKLPGPPSKISTLLNSGDPQPPNNLVKVRDAIFISVFMTAVLTATLVTLLLSCYFACEKKSRYTGYRRKDDKPLLTLSLSNVSGSSQKSFGNRNSLLALPKPLETDPTSQNIQVSSTDSSVDTESTEIFQASPNFGSSQKSFGNGNSLLVPPKPLKPNPTSQNIQLSFTDSSVDTESTEIFQASPNFGSSQKSFGNGSSLLAPPKPLKTDPTSQNIQVSSTDSSVETESSKLFQDSPNFGSSHKSFGNVNSLLALPNPLKTDPTSQNIQVSSTDSSVETQSSEVLQASPFSLDEQSNIITDETNLSKSPPPPPPPVVSTPLGKPSPPSPPPLKAGPSPPPPPKCAAPPRPPQAKLNFLRLHKPPPHAPKLPGETVDVEDDSYAPKTKLKPFFWDKVQANCARSMVWDRLRTGSFQFDEEMIENLFGYSDKNKEGKKVLSPKDAGRQYVRILDPKKSQNLAISLRALNVKSEEVREALMEGNELPPELLHTLLKMAPTTDEEMKIRLHADPTQLGPAEQFIRTIVDVPFAFQRLEALLFMISLQEESSSISEAFSVIDVACKELKSSRLFLKLLEAVLKMGNRMNDGTYRGRAQAFKLDTLLKLSDVKGTDGKTTLLHFVVREIIRTEGKRASRTTGESPSSISSLNSEDLFDDPPVESGDYYYNLGFKVVSGLSDELQHVRKAAGLDADMLANNVESLRERLAKTKDFLKTKMEGIDEESEFLRSLRGFVKHAEAEINTLSEEDKRIRSLVKNTTDYFHGNSAKDEGLRMLVIVRDFLGMIDKVCKEVKVLPKPAIKTQRSREVTPAMSPARDPRQLLFPAIKDRRMNSSDSSDDDD